MGCCLTTLADPEAYQDAQLYFEKQGMILPPLRKGSAIHWRTRAKLAVRGSSAKPLIGLYKEGTHAIVDISQCSAHHPKINEGIALVKEWMRKERIEPYDESAHQGTLRYLQLAVERSSGKVQLTLVLNRPLPHVNLLYSHPLWHSVWVNHNTRKDNVIFGKEWERMAGETFLWENYENTAVAFLPQSFAQANPEMFTQLLVSLKKQIPPNCNLVEYYAGVGVIGLVLADRCQSVICSEITVDGKSCFEASKAKLTRFPGEHISYQIGSADDLLNLLPKGNVILVDPPRKGLDPKLLKALQTAENKILFYISCGWDSFKRDCDQLLAAGWKLQSAEACLFFPGSSHIETLAVLKK